MKLCSLSCLCDDKAHTLRQTHCLLHLFHWVCVSRSPPASLSPPLTAVVSDPAGDDARGTGAHAAHVHPVDQSERRRTGHTGHHRMSSTCLPPPFTDTDTQTQTDTDRHTSSPDFSSGICPTAWPTGSAHSTMVLSAVMVFVHTRTGRPPTSLIYFLYKKLILIKQKGTPPHRQCNAVLPVQLTHYLYTHTHMHTQFTSRPPLVVNMKSSQSTSWWSWSHLDPSRPSSPLLPPPPRRSGTWEMVGAFIPGAPWDLTPTLSCPSWPCVSSFCGLPCKDVVEFFCCTYCIPAIK